VTPAEVLAAAADKLEALATGATPELRLDDVESGLFPEDIAYIEAMNPLVGKALTELFRMEFARIDATEKAHPPYRPDPEVLALARLIIGGES
jgi:hypothetical protein